jgi:hypothetical protein
LLLKEKTKENMPKNALKTEKKGDLRENSPAKLRLGQPRHVFTGPSLILSFSPHSIN